MDATHFKVRCLTTTTWRELPFSFGFEMGRRVKSRQAAFDGVHWSHFGWHCSHDPKSPVEAEDVLLKPRAEGT